MSTPLEQQQPPSIGVSQQADSAQTGHGSVGPVIAVVAVVTILGIIAGMIGRLCSGRPIMGHGGRYDFGGWVERKCSSCLDGTVVDPPPSRPKEEEEDEEHVAVSAEETQQEIKEEEHEEAQVQGEYQHGSSSKS